MEWISKVSEKDRFLGKFNSKDLYSKKIRHRVVHVFLLDGGGNILIQKRSKLKSYCPLYWSSSSQGLVRYGETYASAAKRETCEEIGIKVKVRFLGKIKYSSDVNKFIGVFIARYTNERLVINRDEVSKVKWVQWRILKEFLKSQNVHPELKWILQNKEISNRLYNSQN